MSDGIATVELLGDQIDYHKKLIEQGGFAFLLRKQRVAVAKNLAAMHRDFGNLNWDKITESMQLYFLDEADKAICAVYTALNNYELKTTGIKSLPEKPGSLVSCGDVVRFKL